MLQIRGAWQDRWAVTAIHHDFTDDPLPRLVEALLRELGEDPTRGGLVGTPERVARTLRFLTEGYTMDAHEAVADALFDQEYDEMVLVREVPFFSLCEHHMLPFFGSAHVAYMPGGRVVGLSKIPRLVDVFAHRLQLQERMTRQIAEALDEATHARGVAVVVEARHLCMEMRGVEKIGGQTVTSCMLGCFRSDARTRAEFLDLIRTRG
jgi:GTP cyclohydrolase I